MRIAHLFGTVSYLVLAGAAAVWCASGQASAQQVADASAGTAIEEVHVSASRRGDESVMSTPMSVTALSEEDLAKAKVSDFQDLQKIDPSLNVTNYGPGQSRLIIRGIESPIGSTTGLYLDEAPVLGAVSLVGDGKPNVELHDIDHVEVLKGPQGTLFGAGSMSGTVRVIPAAPDLTRFEGHAEASAADRDGGNPFYDGSVTLNLPVVQDKLGVRLVAWADSGGGYIDQTIAGVVHRNVNETHTKGARLTGLWQVDDKLALTLTETTQAISVPGTIAWQQSLGAYNSNVRSQEFYRDNYNLLQGKAEYDLGFGDFVASVSYGDQQVFAAKDTSPTNASFGIPIPAVYSNNLNYHNLSSEARFASKFSGPFQFVVGVFHLETVQTNQADVVSVNPATGTPPCYSLAQCNAAGVRQPGRGNSLYEFGTNTVFTSSESAVFLQGDYQILPTLTATVGFRYYYANIRSSIFNLQTVFPDWVFGIVDPVTLTDSSRAHQDHPSYNYSLLWQVDDTVNLYARAASGFRIGGVNQSTNLAASFGVTVPPTYKPDHLWNYEVGAKALFLDGTLSVNASIYRIDWFGEQLRAQTASGTVRYVVNGGNTATNGGEIAVKYRPSERIDLGGSLTYVDSFLEQNLPAAVAAAGTPGNTGDALPFTAHISYNLNGEYHQPVMEGWQGYFGLMLNYRSEEFSSFRPGSVATAYTRLPEYYMLDARIGVRSAAWDVSLFANNLNNAVTYQGVYDVPPDTPRIFSAPPRTIGISVSAKF